MTPYLGAALTPIVGREQELLAIESRLATGSRLITLLGPGGSGKTTLARQIYARRRGQGTEAYFVDLVGISDPGLVPAEIATELGVTETAELDAASAVVAALRESSALIVLDNLEELTDAKEFVTRLLQSAHAVQLIATSRIPLGIPGEVEFQVPQLDLPLGDGLADLEASPAARLFLERARAVGRLDKVDASTAGAIAHLCRRLDGLPLALELAAARTRILPPAAILRHIDEHKTGLLAKVSQDDARHESLDAVLSWSLDLLGRNEAGVLGAVAICPGGFDLAIAETLCPERSVLQALDLLASYGLLLQRGEIEGEPWYRLLETIRSAAIDRAPEDEINARWERLAVHVFERVAGTREAYNTMDEVAFRRLDALLDAVRGVLDWTETNNRALNLSIAAHFNPYWRFRGRSWEAIQRLRVAIEFEPFPSSDLALAYIGLSILELDRGHLEEARRDASEAVRIARIAGDPEREIAGLYGLVTTSDIATPKASSRLRKLLQTVEHPVSRYLCLTAIAWEATYESGFSDAVMSHFRDAELALSGTPYRRLQGMATANSAQMSLYADRPVDAFEQSTRALLVLGDVEPEQRAWIIAIRANAASRCGQFAEAIASLRTVLELVDSVGLEVTPEEMVAAVAVLSVSNAPLLAAKVWGATTGEFNSALQGPDRALGEHLVVYAREATDPVSFEVAYKAGQHAGVARVVDEVRAALELVAESGRPTGPIRLLHGTLTAREIEVLALVGAGKTDGDIAAELFISPKTASVHVSNAKAKLGVDTRLEAALWARERGLVHDTRDF